MSEPAPAVELRGLRKDFDAGAVRALRGLDLTVRQGEWVAVRGPSGCGKSTLLHLLAGLDRPTEGTIRVFGRPLPTGREASRYRARTVGLVFQLHNLLPDLTAVQNVEIAMFGWARRADRHARALRLLDDVGLDGRDRRRPPELSGGERQRVAIARALANGPAVLLADEPTGNLDADSVERVIGLLSRLRRERPDLTVLMVTHDERVAAAADRIVTMRDGKLHRDAPLTDDATNAPAATGPVGAA